MGVRQGAPVVEPSAQLPRPASTSTVSSFVYSPTSPARSAASGKGGGAVPPFYATIPQSASRPTSVAGLASGKSGGALSSYAPSASSWLPEDHINHSAQMAQFVTASVALQRDGLIASTRHPNRASFAAALRESQLPAAETSQPQAALTAEQQDPRLERCTHLNGIIARPAGRVHLVTGRWQGAFVETSSGNVFINRGDRVFPHGQTRAIPAHDNIPEVPVGTNV